MDKTYIYLVENCYGSPNKVYIGKEKNNKLFTRESAHRKTYGNNIIYSYIDEVNSLNKDDWKSLETYWIHQFRTWGFDVQNKNDGGGGPITHSKESIEKYKIWRKDKKPALGKKQSVETRLKKSKALKGRPKPEGFGDEMRKVRIGKPKPKGTGEKISKALLGRISKKAKIVIQSKLDGTYITEYPNTLIAGDKTNSNPSTISKVCRGIFSQTNGFKWKYK